MKHQPLATATESVSRPEPSGRLAVAPLNGEPWSLPGHGEAYDDCGTFGLRGCVDVHNHHNGLAYIEGYERSCGRAECPVCFEKWAALEAHRALERFEAWARQRGGRPELIKHIVVSPDQSRHGMKASDLRRAAYRIARAAGCRGGFAVFHPYRWRCLVCGLDDESCRCEVARGAWYWSPHFHVLGHGWIEGTGELYRSTGWLVKNLGLRKSLYRTLQYQLSHAGVWKRILPSAKGKVLSLTWFGDMAYSELHVKRRREGRTCPECGRELVPLVWKGGGDKPPPGILAAGWVDRLAVALEGERFLAI